jgi:5-methylcytosine-specific restriction endonuclease McrA
MDQTIATLHERAVSVSTQYRNCEAELISILQEIETRRAYLHLGATSLYDYCVQILRLSESTSYNMITVARKAREIPALKAAIVSGELSVSKARKIAPVLAKDNQEDWIAFAKTQTSREIERAVAEVMPEMAIKETVKFRGANRIEINIGISEEILKNLERVTDLESQRTAKPATREGALDAALEAYLERSDPIRKLARVEARKSERVTAAEPEISTTREVKPVPGQVERKRKALPASIIHAVNRRDRGQCTHRNLRGERCASRRWLQFHHIRPVVLGGADSLENLATLCSSHHAVTHGGFVH